MNYVRQYILVDDLLMSRQREFDKFISKSPKELGKFKPKIIGQNAPSYAQSFLALASEGEAF